MIAQAERFATARLCVKAIEQVRRQLCWFLLPRRLCAMSILLEMIGRGWENFLARPNGSLSLRFYIQPTMASLLALRAGIEDARQGRQGYLWAILTRPERRLQLLHEGWRGAMTPFLLAIALDCIYQLMTVRFVYPLELLFTATLLALVPYALLRGPFNRLARLFLPAARVASGRTNPRQQIHSLRKHIKEGPTQCRANPRRRTGRSPPRWRSPREGTSRTRSSRGVTDLSFPRRPACYGFSILAKIIPGREEAFYEHARTIEKTIAAQPDALAVLKLHYLRWLLFPIKGETYFMYQGIFDTDFDKYTEDAVALFGATGISTGVRESRRISRRTGRPIPASFVKFVRDHQCPSFLEYGEYPYVSADEIKKALKLKAAFSTMLDQMQ